MNLQNLFTKEHIAEVAMNPTAYAQSVEQAETAGVLVGFEFEVCVPAETMKAQAEAAARAAQAALTEPMTAERVARLIKRGNNSLWEGDGNVPYIKWDQYFTPKNISAYPTTMAAKNAITTKRLEAAKSALAEFPQDRLPAWKRLSQNKITRRIREGYYGNQTFTPEQKSLMIIRDIAQRYEDELRSHPGFRERHGSPEDLVWQRLMEPVRKINQGYQINKEDVFRAMFADSVSGFSSAAPIFANINQFFTYDPQAVYDAFGLMMRDPDVPEDVRAMARGDQRSGYRGAVKVLKPALEQTMGADVIVFTSYHQRSKNMTSWYIEPDGSLHPNRGDGAAEVVGPPELPNKALDSLKKFFAMAAEMKLYTSKQNGTGLHINVSIPKELDVLKLAVFLGDQYVLKQFGRENNHYARSVMKQLSHPGSKKVTSTVPVAEDFANPTQTKIDLPKLQQIAKDISNDHFASISHNGKYVSFRHAGGDYLKDYTEILNVVGRFVRAMVIAADPNAYRNEYLKAVAKLVGQREPALRAQDNSGYIEFIKSNGLIVRTVDMFSRGHPNPTTAFNQMIEGHPLANTNIPGVTVLGMKPNSTEAQSKLIAASRADGRARREMTAEETGDISNFAQVTLIPYTQDEWVRAMRLARETGVQLGRGQNNNVLGYLYVDSETVPATDPRAVKFIRQLQIRGRRS